MTDALIQMFDTVTVETVPPNPQAVAGYTGGNWPTYNELVAKFPNAYHLSIAVQAYHHGRALDVEQGDATNSEAAGWFRNYADHSQGKPVVYTFAANCQALINALAADGINRDQYYLWSAHWTFQPHICGKTLPLCGYPVADLTQWTDKSMGRNLDESLVESYVFNAPKPVIIDIPEDAQMITATGENGHIHVFVEVPHSKDDPTKGSVVYEVYQNAAGSWAGGAQGKQKALAYKLVDIPADIA